MVVFGAGASYDSRNDIRPPGGVPHYANDLRPPLGQQLFEARTQFARVLDEFPSMQVVIGELRAIQDKPSPSIEEQLEAFFESAQSGNDPQRWRHLAAIRFYLRRALWNCQEWAAQTHGVTNYSTFVGRIRLWALKHKQRVTFVTFNYDMLIDAACYELLIDPPDLDSYVSRPEFALIKFHGSIRWQRSIANSRAVFGDDEPYVRDIIRRFGEVELTPSITVASQRDIDVTEQIPYRSSAVPALSIPLVTKAEAECPPEHLKRLDGDLREVDRLLTIGWRGSELHFWRRWRGKVQREIQVHHVGSSPQVPDPLANSIEKYLRIPRAKLGVTGGGFSRFLHDTTDLEGFLSRSL